MKHIREIVETTEKAAVDHIITLSGQSFTLGVVAPNAGQFFIILKPFDERRDPKLYYLAILDRLTKKIAAEVPEAMALLFGPPPLQGLGNASGFRVMVEDRGDLGEQALERETTHLVAVAAPPPPRCGQCPNCERLTGQNRGAINAGGRPETAGYCPPKAERRVHDRQCELPAAICRRQPRSMPNDGLAVARRVRHAANVSRLAVCQRFQSLRPHLGSRGASRREISQSRGGRAASPSAQRGGQDGAAGLGRQTCG